MTRPTDRRSFLQTAGGMAALSLLPGLDPLLAAPLRAPVNVGLIGVGRQGRSILGELQKIDNVAVTCLCDTVESRRKNGLRRARGAEAMEDYRAVLDRKDIQAIVVATPTHLHRTIAIDALQAGKHVYCESPLAASIDDARAIAQAARGADTVFQTGFQGRSNPIYKLAWKFARSGSIRDITSMRAQHHGKTSWRTPANDAETNRRLNWRLDPEISTGLAGEIGAQQFDVINLFRNDYPISVSGRGFVGLHDDGREVADTIACTHAYADGATLQYDASLSNSFEGTYEVLCGTMGTMKLTWTHGWLFKEADSATQGWEVYANRQQFHDEEGITLIADATQLAAQGRLKDGVGLPNDSLYYALGDFLQATDGSVQPACSADEGFRATVVGLETNRAIREGITLPLDEAALKV